jgi:lipoate-protein ligase A
MERARLIDLELVSGRFFHAAYAAVARCMGNEDPPAVVWGRAAAHVCIGRHQSREAELAAELEVPVVRRPLGGGCVWIDPDQYCFALVVPRARLRGRPADWVEWALAPACATYALFGLPVERVQQDLWCRGRKIAGSGSASIGRAAVIGSSFLCRFPAERFARAVASPSEAFRAWLVEELSEAVSDWAREGEPPAAEALLDAFRHACGEELGWRLERASLTREERSALGYSLDEEEDEPWCEPPPRRAVRHGLKLNAERFLVERRAGRHWVRLVIDRRRIVRAAASDEEVQARLEEALGLAVEEEALGRALASLPATRSAGWSRLILEAAPPLP